MQRRSLFGSTSSICPVCGVFLNVSDTTPDQNVKCDRCDYTGYRALSNGYGYGHVIPEDVDLSPLNRGGERWTEEMDGRLDMMGCPYLSPMADFIEEKTTKCLTAKLENQPVEMDGQEEKCMLQHVRFVELLLKYHSNQLW